VEWVAKYQTLIASVVALCAAVGGAMLNAHFNRRQQDRIRHQDAVALAATLAAEITMLHVMADAMTSQLAIIEDSVRVIEPEEKRQWSTWVHFAHQKPGYEKLSERFGLLGPNLSLKVASFYTMYVDSADKLAEFKDAELTAKDALTKCVFLRGLLQRVHETGMQVVEALLKFSRT
jgi:hypothetical protein